MRLIDVEALIEFIENRYEITWKNDYEGGIKDACTDILEKISKMPTIEPERKKGNWIGIEREDKTLPGISECWCSECFNYAPLMPNDEFPNFCPNCGTDMRGNNNE